MNIEYRNKLFDFVMTEALKEYMDIELKEVDEIVAKEPPFEFSPQYKKKMCKIINSVGRKDRIKQIKHIAVKSVVSVAVAVSLIFGGLLTQPEVFAAVQNVFRSVLDKYDKYEFAGEELTVDNFDNSFRLGYVPDGYYLTEGNYSRIFVTLVYSNEVDTIKFKYGISDDWTSYYDNEHNSYDIFYHNGIEYHYYESNNADFYSTLIWYENGYSFSVLAHLPKDEFVKIAENVEN